MKQKGEIGTKKKYLSALLIANIQKIPMSFTFIDKQLKMKLGAKFVVYYVTKMLKKLKLIEWNNNTKIFYTIIWTFFQNYSCYMTMFRCMRVSYIFFFLYTLISRFYDSRAHAQREEKKDFLQLYTRKMSRNNNFKWNCRHFSIFKIELNFI